MKPILENKNQKMIPFLDAHTLQQADQVTQQNRGISSLALMDLAVDALLPYALALPSSPLHIICGPGNNGADGLALAQKIQQTGRPVRVTYTGWSTNYSSEFEHHLRQIQSQHPSLPLVCLMQPIDIQIHKNEIILDALFGNGLRGVLAGPYLELITRVNTHKNPVYSIDMPSGLMHNASGQAPQTFIQPTCVWVLEIPRLSLIDPNHNTPFVVIPFGLNREYISNQTATHYLVEPQDVMLPGRSKNTYKNREGHVLIIGGSEGMYGAPLLSGIAAFKAGAGMVSLQMPKEAQVIVHTALPEALFWERNQQGTMGGINESLYALYQAFLLGPGLGQTSHTTSSLIELLKVRREHLADCTVLDADALNIISREGAHSLIPKGSILTPHEGEFARLIGRKVQGMARYDALLALANQTQSYIVLKGANTCIGTPEGRIYVNNTGGPSLATAGSGDVLAGFIAGMLARGIKPGKAALSGVYYHGIAGEVFGGKPARASEIAQNLRWDTE